MARSPQKINVIIHEPEDIHEVFWNEKTEAFWMEIIEKRILNSHVDLSLLKQVLNDNAEKEAKESACPTKKRVFP